MLDLGTGLAPHKLGRHPKATFPPAHVTTKPVTQVLPLSHQLSLLREPFPP